MPKVSESASLNAEYGVQWEINQLTRWKSACLRGICIPLLANCGYDLRPIVELISGQNFR